jgi:UDP-N-acetylglucosamine/UDP-N-acetylgalactosamine diphosphorylase
MSTTTATAGSNATQSQLEQRVERRLAAIQQSHVLAFVPTLTPAQRAALYAQVDGLPLEEMPALIDAYVKHKPEFVLPKDIRPAKAYALHAKDWDRAAMRAAGESLMRRSAVAAFVVAGGQGSRLGFEGPKGCYPAGAVSRKPLFQIFAEGIKATQRAYSCCVPWYIMTSPLNHEQTVSFFRQHNSFGLDPTNIMFFQQGVLPSLDISSGKILLASPHEVATNPDGHGGSVRALHVSGALHDMRRRGIEHVSYFQVDNPLVRVVDPVFLGLHATAKDSSGEMSSKMVAKSEPGEKVGVFCMANAKTQVLEYSDMPKALQEERTPEGAIRYNAGSIAIHAMSVAFLERLATDAKFSLPCHRAEKKIPCIDAQGHAIVPSGNNGVKLEKFIFDALELCERSIVMETDRIEEFAPIKNATGVDSVESSRHLQTQRAARWLAMAGVTVPMTSDGFPDCTLEVSPLTALDPKDLVVAKLPKIDPGASVVL